MDKKFYAITFLNGHSYDAFSTYLFKVFDYSHRRYFEAYGLKNGMYRIILKLQICEYYELFDGSSDYDTFTRGYSTRLALKEHLNDLDLFHYHI